MSYEVYFQKASLKSFLSLQLLVGISLFALMLFETSLAIFDVFLHGTPYFTFTVFFILTIFYPVALPLLSVFLITIFHDIFATSLFNSQTFAILLSLIVIKRLMTFPEQRDFLEIWQGFGIAIAIMTLVQALFFMATELAWVNIQGLIFQFGISLLLYPFLHAMTLRVAQAFVQTAER